MGLLLTIGSSTTITTIVRMQAFNLSPTSDRTCELSNIV